MSTDLRRTAWRIGLQTAGLLIACLLVVSTVVYVAVVRSQEEHLRQTLTDAVGEAAPGDQRRDHDGDDRRFRLRLQGGTFTAVLHDGEVTSSEQLPPGLPNVAVMEQVRSTGVEDRRRVDLSTGPYEILTVSRGDDVVVQAMASLLEQHQERERIIGALVIAGGAGLVLATLAAVVLARRAVTPMSQALESQRRFVADAGTRAPYPVDAAQYASPAAGPADPDRSRRSPTAHRRPGADDRDQLITRDVEGIVADTSALTAILEELLLAADTRTPVPQESCRRRSAGDHGGRLGAGDRGRSRDRADPAAADGRHSPARRRPDRARPIGDRAGRQRPRPRPLGGGCDRRPPRSRRSWSRSATTDRASAMTCCRGCSPGSPATAPRPLSRGPAPLRSRAGPGQRDRHPARRHRHRRQPARPRHRRRTPPGTTWIVERLRQFVIASRLTGSERRPATAAFRAVGTARGDARGRVAGIEESKLGPCRARWRREHIRPGARGHTMTSDLLAI